MQPSGATSSGSVAAILLHGHLLTPNTSLPVVKGRNFDLLVYMSSPESVTHEATGDDKLDAKKNVSPTTGGVNLKSHERWKKERTESEVLPREGF